MSHGDKYILLDCDGVLANFVQGTIRAHSRSVSHDSVRKWNYFEDWGLSASQFWEGCRGRGFWMGLDEYPWAQELVCRLREIGDITISTSPPADADSVRAKIDWLYDHFRFGVKDVMVGSKKWLMAHPNAILIDDSPENIQAFKAKGGIGILFPQPWNSREGDWQDVIDEVEDWFGHKAVTRSVK